MRPHALLDAFIRYGLQWKRITGTAFVNWVSSSTVPSLSIDVRLRYSLFVSTVVM